MAESLDQGGKMSRTPLTERQYVELRSYDHGHPSWRPHKPGARLLDANLLEPVPGAGPGVYRITDAGSFAIAAFRERHGLPAGV